MAEQNVLRPLEKERSPADTALIEKIAKGFMVESEEDMTPGYKKALLTQLTVQGDTELLSAPAYYLASRDAPSINSRIASALTSSTCLPPVARNSWRKFSTRRGMSSRRSCSGGILIRATRMR